MGVASIRTDRLNRAAVISVLRRDYRLDATASRGILEEIVRRYGKPLTRYAAAIVDSRAEDVTQDAFSKALLALRRDSREIELRPWLFRIVRNTALNELRDRPPSTEALAEAIAGGGSPEEEVERREELADLMRRLQSLPEAQRAAIVMRELEGLSHEEIAAALGLSGGGARQTIFRARRALRDGAGMLLPLPLLKGLLTGAASAPVEAAAGAAGVSGIAGVGVATKATLATVLVAGAVGAGVAIDHGRQASPADSAVPTPTELGDGSRGKSGSGGHNRHGESEPGDDRGGHRGGGGGGESGGDRGGSSAHGSGDSSGSSGSSGSGSDSSGSGEGSSGPGSGSGVESGSNSGSNGDGSGDSALDDSSGSDGSGDSHGGDGFSLQMEPQS